MLSKRGQVTTFIILGILILVIVIGILYTQDVFLKGKLRLGIQEAVVLPPQIQKINNFVEESIGSVGEEALYILGQQGGYIEPTELSTDYTVHNIAYFIYKEKNTMPEKSIIEKEISSYISDELPYKTKFFSDFPSFDIETGEIKVETRIIKNEINFEVEWPLLIKKDESTYELSNFKTSIPSRLDIIYKLAKDITIEQLKDIKNICLSCIAESAKSNDLIIGLMEQEEEDIIFTIFDNSTMIENKSYEFVFANRYEIE